MNMDTDSNIDFNTPRIDRSIAFSQSIRLTTTPFGFGTLPPQSNTNFSIIQGSFIQGVSTSTGFNSGVFQSGAPGSQSFTSSSFDQISSPANFEFGASQPYKSGDPPADAVSFNASTSTNTLFNFDTFQLNTSSTNSPIHFSTLSAPPNSAANSPTQSQVTFQIRTESIIPSAILRKAYKYELPEEVWMNPRIWVRNLDKENPDYELTHADHVAGWELAVKKAVRPVIVLKKCGESKTEIEVVVGEYKDSINQKPFLLKKEYATEKREEKPARFKDARYQAKKAEREKMKQDPIARSSQTAATGPKKKMVKAERKKVHWSEDTKPSKEKGKDGMETSMEMMGKTRERQKQPAGRRRQKKLAARKAREDKENLEKMMSGFGGLALESESAMEEDDMEEGHALLF